MDNKLILVTGPLGWLGYSLINALYGKMEEVSLLQKSFNNIQVRCMILPDQDVKPIKQLSKNIDVIKGDIRNQDDCEKFCHGAAESIIFHTAGVIHPVKIADFYQINVDGTKKLLTSAIKAGVKRAVVVSSNSPCGCNPHPDHLFDEESPYNPYMNYGKSKMMMEKVVKKIHEEGKLETVLIRPPWFYGPNQPPRQTLFFQMIRDGKVPIVGDGNNMRSMAYIENLCQGLLLSATKERASGQIYWIADKRPYSMNEIIDTVERLLESEFNQKCVHKRIRLPGVVSEIALIADATLQKVGIYQQKIHVLSEMNKTIACSIKKAEEELGYKPKVDLEEGMRRSIKWIINKYGNLQNL